jgi:hypothetical protein
MYKNKYNRNTNVFSLPFFKYIEFIIDNKITNTIDVKNGTEFSNVIVIGIIK